MLPLHSENLMEQIESIQMLSTGDLSQCASTPTSVALDGSTQAVFYEDGGAFDQEDAVFGMVGGPDVGTLFYGGLGGMRG